MSIRIWSWRKIDQTNGFSQPTEEAQRRRKQPYTDLWIQYSWQSFNLAGSSYLAYLNYKFLKPKEDAPRTAFDPMQNTTLPFVLRTARESLVPGAQACLGTQDGGKIG